MIAESGAGTNEQENGIGFRHGRVRSETRAIRVGGCEQFQILTVECFATNHPPPETGR